MKIWSVNTNISSFKSDKGADIILNQNRVVTWYRDELKNINIGDLVLSYNNNKTIIAVGYAISDTKKYIEIHHDTTQEQWIDIDWIWKCKEDLSNPIKLENIESDIKVSMFLGTSFNWTKNINSFKLLEEIGKRKYKENK